MKVGGRGGAPWQGRDARVIAPSSLHVLFTYLNTRALAILKTYSYRCFHVASLFEIACLTEYEFHFIRAVSETFRHWNWIQDFLKAERQRINSTPASNDKRICMEIDFKYFISGLEKGYFYSFYRPWVRNRKSWSQVHRPKKWKLLQALSLFVR